MGFRMYTRHPWMLYSPTLVPEPHSLGLLVVALAAFGLVRYHKQV